MDPVFRKKPWWLNLFTPAGSWVTMAPVVYHPDHMDPAAWPALVEHEKVHLRQQEALGKWRWILRYVWHEDWMLSQEAEAVAAEVLASPVPQRPGIIDRYVAMFVNRDGAYETADHHTCAVSVAQARLAILMAIQRAGGVPE